MVRVTGVWWYAWLVFDGTCDWCLMVHVSDLSRSSRTRCRRYGCVWTCARSSVTRASWSTTPSSPSNTCVARCSLSSSTPRCWPASRYVTHHTCITIEHTLDRQLWLIHIELWTCTEIGTKCPTRCIESGNVQFFWSFPLLCIQYYWQLTSMLGMIIVVMYCVRWVLWTVVSVAEIPDPERPAEGTPAWRAHRLHWSHRLRQNNLHQWLLTGPCTTRGELNNLHQWLLTGPCTTRGE